MILAQTHYLEVQFEKLGADGGFFDADSSKDHEGEEADEAGGGSGSKDTAGPGLLVFGGKAGKYLTHHAMADEGSGTPGPVSDELASFFSRIILTHVHSDNGVVQTASIIAGVSDTLWS